MKTHNLSDPSSGDPPAYLANGLVGLRVDPVPLPGGTALVGGFVGLSPEKATEEYAYAPYPVGADIQVNGVWLSDRPDLVHFESQQYDFSSGELNSRFTFRAGSHNACMEVLTFCSRRQPTLTLQQISVELNQPARLVLQSRIDQRGLEGRLLYRCMPARHQDAILHWESRGGLASVGVASGTEYLGDNLLQRRRNDFGHEEDMELTEYHVEAKAGQRYMIRQLASLVPSIMHGEPHMQAARLVGQAQWLGFTKIREDNREAWAELWKGRARLTGADSKWQDLADAAFFYVHCSVSGSSPSSVAPFGLSMRQNYSGHVFWDADGFVLPAVLLAAPEAARSIVDYRSRGLAAARANSRLNGFAGVQFPWQGGNSGWEVTPFYSLGGMGEHHINPDVAIAVAQYLHAAGDDQFLEKAWPILKGVAEWIVSRATHTTRGFEIRHVTGPDEYFDNVHNNAFTNMAAILALREAISLAKRLNFSVPSRWSEVEQNLYLPIDRCTNVMLKHDGYTYKSGICVPETLAGFFPHGYEPDPAVQEATYDFHLDLAGTYSGMPMFSSFLGVWAARRGDRNRSLQMLQEGVGETVTAPFHQFLESAPQIAGRCGYGNPQKKETMFLANAAGFLMCCYLGFPGLQIDGGTISGWSKHPVSLPEGWKKIEVERLWVRGQPMRLQAPHGSEQAKLEPI